MDKNTVLFIEPRVYDECPLILNHFVNVLGDNWNYVFYCGKNKRTHWENAGVNSLWELRELDIDNFTSSDLYSDFMKQYSLWDSLYGEFVLTAQMDAWITNDNGHTIYDFINLNKSFIGGNMNYDWFELCNREQIYVPHKNFNGGLSLRKRNDMLRIIQSFPPEKTGNEPDVTKQTIHSDAEDVYFVLGCYKLGLPLGDDEYCSRFCVSGFMTDTFFGIHKPWRHVGLQILEKIPDLKQVNPHVFFYK
jgi:hypothetical protein